MKKYLSILTALLVAGLFTAVNVSAYDYIYGDTRPDDSFYFTTRGTLDDDVYTLGAYITGVKDVVAGDVIEFDVNISGITNESGLKAATWDFLYTNNLEQTMYGDTYNGILTNSNYSDWAYYNNPDTNIWTDQGYGMYDSTHSQRRGDVALMQINMTADDAFDSLLPEADGMIDLVWHWSAGTEGDIVMEDNTYYNILEDPSSYYYAHHDLSGLGDCRLLINPVPIPGALWLIGSAFLCILGINNRRGRN